MNRQTYVVAQLSVTVWICFLTQGVVDAILKQTVTHVQMIQQALSLASLGITTGIAYTIMGYLKYAFNSWMAEYWKQKKMIAEMILSVAKADQDERRRTIGRELIRQSKEPMDEDSSPKQLKFI